MPDPGRSGRDEYVSDPRRAEIDTLLDCLRRVELERDALRRELADLKCERIVATGGVYA